jgi:hypothetical protein
MYIKGEKQQQLWIICKGCGKKRRISESGSCSCGNIKISRPDKHGVISIEADDTDAVVYDNEK